MAQNREMEDGEYRYIGEGGNDDFVCKADKMSRISSLSFTGGDSEVFKKVYSISGSMFQAKLSK